MVVLAVAGGVPAEAQPSATGKTEPQPSVSTLRVTLEAATGAGRGDAAPSEEGAAPNEELVTVVVRSRKLAEPLRASAELPGGVTLSVPADAGVRITVEAPGLWAPPEALWVGRGQHVAHVRLQPTGVVEGSIAVPAGVKPPQRLDVLFRSAPGAPDPLRGEHTQGCPLDEDRFRCELPAGALDARFGSRGFVSVFRWGLEVPEHATVPLGSLALRPGASVIGWLRGDGEGFDPKQARVHLAPQSTGLPSAAGAERADAIERVAKVNDRGFFELADVSPGSYRVTAEHPGFAPAILSPVIVREGVEVELPLLELALPLSLDLTVQPLRDPFHQPWSLRLAQEGALPGVLEEAAAGVVDEDGVFHATGLAPGSYELTVRDSRGSRWHAETLDLVAEARHEVVLPYDRLEALLTLAGEPLVDAVVSFGGRRGAQRLVARSDDEGKVYVFLPRRESWVADVEKEAIHLQARVEGIVVERDPDEPWAKIEIEVPDTRVFGQVVDELGRALPGAMVDVAGPHGGGSLRVFASADGEFEGRGFGEGRWRLEAKHRDESEDVSRSAAVVEVEVDAGSPTGPVELVARAGWELSGLVVAPNGNGVPGATVVFGFEVPGGPMHIEIPYRITDVDGSFQLPVPRHVAAVQLQVYPPGYAARQLRVTLPRAEPVIVPVDAIAGTLRLTVSSQAALPAGFLQRAAVFGEYLYYAPFLRRWAGIHGLHGEDDRLVVPSMEPGVYTACWDVVRAALTGGRLPPGLEDRCVTGTLTPGGELALELPVPEPAATELAAPGAAPGG